MAILNIPMFAGFTQRKSPVIGSIVMESVAGGVVQDGIVEPFVPRLGVNS